MGTKKRGLESIDEVEPEGHIDKAESDEQSRKNLKKEKKKDGENTSASSVKPMERRKKRKALDKERRGVASEKCESKPVQTDLELQAADESKPVQKDESKPEQPASSDGLPEFHITVFKDLVSVNASIREAAVEMMVMELQEVQKVYDEIGKNGLIARGLQLEAEKDDGLNNCAPSLRYAVRRLIRGVSSSRECARQGFALGLTVLLHKIPSIKVQSLLKLIVNLLEVSSSMKGQEAKDCLLGRLFAYGALLRSGRLVEEWIHDKNTPYIKEFTNLMISLAAKKRYLQEPSVSVILDLVEKLPSEALFSHVLEAPGISDWFEGATEAGNPDALLLALKIREKVSADIKIFDKLLPNPFSRSKLFATNHLLSLVNCLKESTFCQPRIHGVWPVLVNSLLPDVVILNEDVLSGSSSMKKLKKSRKCSSSEEEIAKNLQCFFDVIIEGSLLPSSHDRKHLAFDVLLLLFPRLPAPFIPIALSYKVVQCLMDILSTKDTWLYKVAQHFLKELSDWVRHDDVRKVSIVMTLQRHSSGKFDCITRTRTVKDLMAEFKTESGCMLFIQNLTNMFVDDGHALEEPSDQSQTTDDNSEIGSTEDKDPVGPSGNSDFLRSWIIESLPSILKYAKLDPEAMSRVQIEILKFLAVQGLFSSSLGSELTSLELQEKFRWPKVATSGALCRLCIEQLQSLLAYAQKGEGQKVEVQEGEGLLPVKSIREPMDLGSYFMGFLSTLRNIPSVSLFRTLSNEDEKVFTKLQATESTLCREERNVRPSTIANKLHALRYLLIQVLLQVLLRPGEFSEAASELILCCKKAFSSSDLLESSSEDELDDNETPELMDVLVDTLLSLLPQSSAPMRSAIEQVFKYFCHDVTVDGLLRMLRVIKKDLKPARHQDAESEDDSEDDDDFLDIEEGEEVDEAETGETGESDEQTDDSEAVVGVEEGDQEIPEASDDSDGEMDDDAMFRADALLARIFKERKNQAGSETAHSQLVLFKLRVLSLLEIYLHENPEKPQVLLVYSNLAQAYVNPHTVEGSEQLGQRIWGILQKKIFKAKEFPKGEALQLSTLESLLEKNLKWASKPFKKKRSSENLSKKKQLTSRNRHKMIGSLAQNSVYWLLKIIDTRKFPESELEGFFDIFKGVLLGYFNSKKIQIKFNFLKEIFRRRPWIGHHLLGFLLEKCGAAESEFRRVEALDLVIEILKSPNNVNGQEASKKFLKSHLPKLGLLIKVLVTNMPEKQARRALVRKFCGKVFQIISTSSLSKSFLKDLPPDAHVACETHLGEAFLALKKLER